MTLLERLSKDIDDMPPCKFCGRLVYCGPPCCYQAVWKLYQDSQSEVLWLRKVRGKQQRTINSLIKQLKELK